MFLSKKKNLEGVHLGQIKPLFVVKKNLFVCLRASTAWMVSLLVKKTCICSQKNIFACPRVPSSLEGVHFGQKKPLFLVKKTFLCLHGAPPVWKVSIGECPRGPCSLESLNLGQIAKKLFCVSMKPFTKEIGPREGPSGPTKMCFLTKKILFD